MLKRIRHIGVIVPEFDRAVKRFKGFGLSCSEVMEVQKLGAKIAFFSIGDTMIELITHPRPNEGADTMVNVVRDQAGAINHICFEVDDLEQTIKDFERNGAKVVVGCPREGAHGRIAFLRPETTEGVLIELCEV